MITIERLPWDAVPWSSLDRFEDRNLYQTLPWLNFVASTQGAEPVVAGVKQDGVVVGYFTGLQVRKFGLRILGSPFKGWTTVCMGFNLPPGFPRHEALKALSSFAFRELGCHHLEVVDRHLDQSRCAGLGYAARTLQTYEVDLTPSEDEMFMRVTGACRRCLRKAARVGVVVEEAADPGFADEYYAQLNDVFVKQSLVPTYGVDRVRELIRHLHPTGNLLLLRARDASGVSMATGIFPAFNGTMYYWGGASWRQYQILRPNEPLMWHAMMYWKARGMKRYDMLGAGREADAYKRRYGAQLVPAGTHLMSSKYALITPMRNVARGIFELRQTVSGWFGASARTLGE
jgi:hypothetical protein